MCVKLIIDYASHKRTTTFQDLKYAEVYVDILIRNFKNQGYEFIQNERYDFDAYINNKKIFNMSLRYE